MQEKLILLTFVSGTINGQDFIASGTGEADTGKGISRAVLNYSRFPEDFTPLMCKSWKCVHHGNIAQEISGGLNLYTICKGNYDIQQTIRYPNNQVIMSTQLVRRIEPDYQIAISRFDGEYKGPIDVAEVLPYEEIIKPAGIGKATFEGIRYIIMADGSKIAIEWSGEMTFVNKTVSMPFEQILRYEILAPTRWDVKTLRYEIEKSVTIRRIG